MDSYLRLYQARCYEGRPHFWKPQPIGEIKPQLLSLEPVEDEEVIEVIQKVIALGLNLELPVGRFVHEACNKDLPSSPHVKTLLKSNEADEAAHYRGFLYAQEQVKSPYLQEASLIRDKWEGLPNHPIELARHLEVAIFLVSLGFLRVLGGKELDLMSMEISKDEARHVSTNTQVCEDLSLSSSNLEKEGEEILDFLFSGFSFRHPLLDYTLNLDFFLEESRSLLEDKVAPRLQELVDFGTYRPPFETANKKLYSRTIEIPMEDFELCNLA